MAKFLGISDPVRNIITVPNEESGRRKRTFVEKLPACRPEGDASLFIGGIVTFVGRWTRMRLTTRLKGLEFGSGGALKRKPKRSEL